MTLGLCVDLWLLIIARLPPEERVDAKRALGVKQKVKLPALDINVPRSGFISLDITANKRYTVEYKDGLTVTTLQTRDEHWSDIHIHWDD